MARTNCEDCGAKFCDGYPSCVDRIKEQLAHAEGKAQGAIEAGEILKRQLADRERELTQVCKDRDGLFYAAEEKKRRIDRALGLLAVAEPIGDGLLNVVMSWVTYESIRAALTGSEEP